MPTTNPVQVIAQHLQSRPTILDFAEELQTISGIGAKRAEDIIAYRESHGGFQSVDDLKNVSGIGDKTLDKIRESIYVA